MNKTKLKKLVATLQYEKVFKILESLEIDIHEEKELHTKSESLRNECISNSRRYTTDEWDKQQERNIQIAKSLLHHIDYSIQYNTKEHE